MKDSVEVNVGQVCSGDGVMDSLGWG